MVYGFKIDLEGNALAKFQELYPQAEKLKVKIDEAHGRHAGTIDQGNMFGESPDQTGFQDYKGWHGLGLYGHRRKDCQKL